MLRNNYKRHTWKYSGIKASASMSEFNWMVVPSLFPFQDAKKLLFPKIKQPFKMVVSSYVSTPLDINHKITFEEQTKCQNWPLNGERLWKY